MEDLQAKQKKEIKTFETEKRLALKKIKGTAGKGKKGKEVLIAAEKEWDQKHETLVDKHKDEIAALSSGGNASEGDGGGGGDTKPTEPTPRWSKDEEAKQKALAKKMRKREKALAKEKEREEEIAHELANAPDPRQMEIDAIMELHLNKDDMDIEEVAADGNCLYRAVATQLDHLGESDFDYRMVRKACAEEILEKREEYEPFADLSEMKVDTFEEYVEKVRDSSEWGGHLELKALAHSLKKTIMVYSTEGPLEIKSESAGADDGGVIRLSFHRQYYALGEHYNSVVKKVNE
eukprot:CAMPEP_0197241216 /NCGR_PEP_ID=MMETSP1429-20130617/7315_1 /TAXON_ID=49237 /ORGANISM="Chaetoceros  sp., Strain UNC1202" /LENGTH=291 /DNA_ID=CAMNT_0042701017 /DNA_START=25 /DNA_END=900 /DNA_ORIENTATION=+